MYILARPGGYSGGKAPEDDHGSTYYFLRLVSLVLDTSWSSVKTNCFGSLMRVAPIDRNFVMIGNELS